MRSWMDSTPMPAPRRPEWLLEEPEPMRGEPILRRMPRDTTEYALLAMVLSFSITASVLMLLTL
ncbi:MAG: hypothetical protein R3F61_35030 [Myxococcota bacterium]